MTRTPPGRFPGGCELCGTYGLPPRDGQPKDRPALTSVATIRRYVDALPARVVPARAARALAYLMDSAASPRESELALLLSLPPLLGGYGLPKPTLNHPVPLGPEAFRLYPHSPCRCDLYWEDRRFAMEYQGEAAHRNRFGEDVARAAALAAEGITVLTLTKEQPDDAAVFTAVAKTVAEKLDRQLRIRREDFVVRNEALRRDLRLR